MKRKIKIGVDARPLSYLLTGIGIYLKHLLNAIQQIDHDNFYYLISNGPILYNLKNPNWSKIEGKYKQKLISTLWLQFNAPIICNKIGLDLFWGTRHNLPLILPARTKTVLTIHDIVHRLYPATMTLENLLIERLLVKRSITKADCVITDSFATVKDLNKYFRAVTNKVNVIYPGIPVLPSIEFPDNVVSDEHTPQNYFLFVGSLDPRKNFDRIFKAFEFIHPTNPDVHLILAGGKGWKNTSFRKIIHSHPLKEYVHLTGYVSRERLKTLYQNALCLLFPSIYEGFGFPILEAMSCGTPVITSKTSSMSEVAGDAALLVDPFNQREISNAMEAVVKNKALRARLRQKGFARCKRFSWETCALQTIGLFERVIVK